MLEVRRTVGETTEEVKELEKRKTKIKESVEEKRRQSAIMGEEEKRLREELAIEEAKLGMKRKKAKGQRDGMRHKEREEKELKEMETLAKEYQRREEALKRRIEEIEMLNEKVNKEYTSMGKSLSAEEL